MISNAASSCLAACLLTSLCHSTVLLKKIIAYILILCCAQIFYSRFVWFGNLIFKGAFVASI